MNDVKDLLARALPDGLSATLAATDPTGDLLRGRSRLRKRRTATFAGVAAVALGVGVVPLALSTTGDASGTPAAVAQDSPTTLPGVELAAYTGKQVPGYRVAWSPKGWTIESSEPTGLVFAEAGAAPRNDLGGKILISLISRDAEPPVDGTVQEVNGRPGRLFDDENLTPAQKAELAKVEAAKLAAVKQSGGKTGKPFPATMSLYYEYKDGRWMMIQAPKSLGWDGSEIAKFASGVKVLKNASDDLG